MNFRLEIMTNNERGIRMDFSTWQSRNRFNGDDRHKYGKKTRVVIHSARFLQLESSDPLMQATYCMEYQVKENIDKDYGRGPINEAEARYQVEFSGIHSDSGFDAGKICLMEKPSSCSKAHLEKSVLPYISRPRKKESSRACNLFDLKAG